MLHHELRMFTEDLLPRLLADHGKMSPEATIQVKHFRQLARFLRRELDAAIHRPDRVLNFERLDHLFRRLQVQRQVDLQSAGPNFQMHTALEFLRCRHSPPGYGFLSYCGVLDPKKIQEHAVRICAFLDRTVEPECAAAAIRAADPDELASAFQKLDCVKFLLLAESLFLIRPSTPISVLPLPRRMDRWALYRFRIADIIKNLLERLSNNHFHVVLEISKLEECCPSSDPYTANRVFAVLFRKWLHLTDGAYVGNLP